MALTDNRFTYVDFSQSPVPMITRKNLNTAHVVTDAHIGVFDVNGHHFELLNIGALSSMAFTPSASGWLLPLGATDGNGLALCQGSTNTPDTKMKFTTGTDAFYLKVKLEQTVLADSDVLMVGFREAGTTQVTTTPALAKTDYDNKALYGVYDNAGACATEVSTAAGVDTETVATYVSVTGVAAVLEVRVNADLSVDFLHDGTTDVLAAAASSVVTTGKVMVPHLIAVSTGAGVEKVELVSWECGLQ